MEVLIAVVIVVQSGVIFSQQKALKRYRRKFVNQQNQIESLKNFAHSEVKAKMRLSRMLQQYPTIRAVLGRIIDLEDQVTTLKFRMLRDHCESGRLRN